MRKSELVKKLNEIYSKVELLESEPVNMVCDEISKVQTKLEYLLDEIEDDDFELAPEETTNESK